MIKIHVSEKDIRKAMTEELRLATTKLCIMNEKPPYFVSYLLRERERFEVWARFGSPYGQKYNQSIDCYAQVRVGSYELDQSVNGGLNNFQSEDSNFWADNLPLDGNIDVLRYALRLLTEDKYREALEGYYRKKSQIVAGAYKQKGPNFSRQTPKKFSEAPKNLDRDVKKWMDLVLPYSKRFRSFPFLKSSFVEMTGERIRTYYRNSEGSDVVTEQIFYALELHALAVDENGSMEKRQRQFFFTTPNQLPSPEQIEEAIEKLALYLQELVKAPRIKPHSGPVLLGPEASGLFFHEVLGHRLEGERLLSDGEGRTLKDKVDENIIPDFLSVYDDPTLETFNGVPLLGHYRFDSEGIASQKVTLIKKGVLKNFLQSRTPINRKSKSNGHGRTEFFKAPMARMGNLIVEGHQPKKSREHLEEFFQRQVRDMGKSFGLIIEEVHAGETDTSNYDFQVFKGQPERILKMDAKTGKKTLVRGLDFIGTPLSAVSKIEATGPDQSVFNSFCTAESGDVRVCSIAPSLYFSDMELQRSNEKTAPVSILPIFWAEPKK